MKLQPPQLNYRRPTTSIDSGKFVYAPCEVEDGDECLLSSAGAAAILACFELAPCPSQLQPRASRLCSLLEIIGYILATSLIPTHSLSPSVD